MRMRRAQHMQPQRAIFRLVVDELPLPGEKSLVFKSLDRLARTKTHIAGKNIHQFVLRVSCSNGRVLADRRRAGQPAFTGKTPKKSSWLTPAGGPSPPWDAWLLRSAAQMDEIFVDCRQFVIVHSSNRPPRHLLAEFMSRGINPGAQGRNELGRLPILHHVQPGTDGTQLPLDSTCQIGT